MNGLAEGVGPVYTQESLEHYLCLTRDEVWDLTYYKSILSLPTADGHTTWPTFQFNGRLIRPSIGPILWMFEPINPEPWSLAVWMNFPQERLGGTPAECLEPALVHQAANETIARWRA